MGKRDGLDLRYHTAFGKGVSRQRNHVSHSAEGFGLGAMVVLVTFREDAVKKPGIRIISSE